MGVSLYFAEQVIQARFGIEGNFIGDEVWFHVKDNGKGRGDPPDQISIVLVEIVPEPSATCDDSIEDLLIKFPELEEEDLALQFIVGGSISVRP